MEKFANGTKAILEKVCEATKNGVATVIGKIRRALAKYQSFFIATPILVIRFISYGNGFDKAIKGRA